MAKNERRSRKDKAGKGSASKAETRRSSEHGYTEPTVPGWLPAVLFLGLTVLIFRDFIFSSDMLFGHDTRGLGYVARAFYADALTRLGDFPAWAPQILGGTPFIEALSAGDSLYPPSVLLLLFMDPHRALGWKLVLHVAAAGFFMFGWIRAIGGSRAAALLAGSGFMLAPYFVTLVHPGHDGKMFVTALTPLLFWAVERHFVRPRMRTFAAIAMVVGLVIFTTHFQMAYFLFLATGCFAFYRAIEMARGSGAGESDGSTVADAPGSAPTDAGDDTIRRTRPSGLTPAALRFGIFLAASIAGAGIAAVQFIPAFNYVTQDSRRVATTREAVGETDKAWASSWSLHPEEAVSLVVPEFVGGSIQTSGGWSEGTYWGRNQFKFNHEYLGLVLLLLAAVSFTGGARSGLRWFFLGMGTLAALFALGANTPVWHIAYEFLRGIDLFRAVSQVIFLTGFAVTTLAALGLDRILTAARDDDQEAWGKIQKTLLGGTAAMGVFLLLAGSGALTSIWTAVVYSDIQPDRQQALQLLSPYILSGAVVALLIAGAVTGLVWALRNHYLAPTGVLAGLIVLVAVDQIRVDARYIQMDDFEAWSAPGPDIQAILQAEANSDEPYRLLSFMGLGQDVDPALHGIELAAGHHPNDLNRYRELIGMVGSGLPENLGYGPIRRLLNVKYVLWPDFQLGPAPAIGPVLSQRQFADGNIYSTLIQENGLPRARLVGQVAVKSDAEVIPYMLTPDFDPEAEVVLTEAPALALDGGVPQGSVVWEERGPDRMTFSVSTDRPAMLVVADNWYPAWHARVNGAEVPVMRAYHTLRAVPLPTGDHVVEMYYASSTVSRSLWVSLILIIGIGGAGLFDLWRGRREGHEA